MNVYIMLFNEYKYNEKCNQNSVRCKLSVPLRTLTVMHLLILCLFIWQILVLNSEWVTQVGGLPCYSITWRVNISLWHWLQLERLLKSPNLNVIHTFLMFINWWVITNCHLSSKTVTEKTSGLWVNINLYDTVHGWVGLVHFHREWISNMHIWSSLDNCINRLISNAGKWRPANKHVTFKAFVEGFVKNIWSTLFMCLPLGHLLHHVKVIHTDLEWRPYSILATTWMQRDSYK